MTHPMPGWYDAPDSSPNAERRWDGHNWTTERRQKATQPAPPSSAYPQYASQQPAYLQPAPQPYQAPASYSQPAPSPQYPQPPYPPQGHAPYATTAPASNLFSIIAFVCAGISVLLFPIVFGPAALILGVVGLTKKERFAPIALAVAAAGMIAGILLGMALAL